MRLLLCYIRSSRVARTLGLVAIVAACADESRFPTEPVRPTVDASYLALSPGGIRPAEALLHAVARDVPGFGGYYLDNNGVLVAHITDLGREAVLRQRLEAVRNRLAVSQVRSITVRQGQFDFPSLAAWRDLVSSQILGVVPGVVMSDADEAANRVTIGIDETRHPDVRGVIARSVQRLGIPPNAVRFVNTQPPSPDVNQHLQDVPVPIVAGYRIYAGAAGGCTLGPVVLHNGNPAAFTNSHCTAAMYAFDGSAMRTSDEAIIGYESFDPSPTCGGACRWSDAALFYLNGGVSYDHARIARTVNSSPTWGIDGSLSVDQSNPTYNVYGVVNPGSVVVGMYVLKTGATSGTTSGFVQRTCNDSFGSDGFVRKCSIHASYYARGGDSGSPVFTWLYGTGGVVLVAIHWGSNALGEYALSSYFTTAMSEVGGSFVATREPPFTVNIEGYSDVNSSPSCRLTYHANVTGGVSPLSYEWQTDGEILENWGETVIANFPGPPEGRFIQVIVTDAVGETAGHFLTMTSSAGSENCYS